ncbi:MAG TPA: HRDC domain-containing protein, partial [Geobacteraceae bacterium]|nr:HRDC domain-containing protein [Geobacteraceae bacterium]
MTTSAALKGLVQRIGGEPLLAFDLEADSLHHYQERVCLIQLSTPRESVLIDPLAFPELSVLAPVLADPTVCKVFHGSDYDIRSLHRDFGIEVCNLFDTMVACQFLGEKELGLAAVLKKRFGVELDKRYQKADWSKRPLVPEMIAYAVEDTRLLIELYGQLVDELRAKGRLSWVKEECDLLSRVRTVSRGEEPLFLRFKGASGMEPRTLAVLEELLRLRDEKARQRDVPAFKILGNETLRELAARKPHKPADLAGVAGLTPKLTERYGEEILGAVARGMAIPAAGLPHYPRQPRRIRDRRQEERLQKLKLWREKKSRELAIEPGILANNALLEALAEADPGATGEQDLLGFMKQWQQEVFG